MVSSESCDWEGFLTPLLLCLSLSRLERLWRLRGQRAGHPGPDQRRGHSGQMGPVQRCGRVAGRSVRELSQEQKLQLCCPHESTRGRYADFLLLALALRSPRLPQEAQVEITTLLLCFSESGTPRRPSNRLMSASPPCSCQSQSFQEDFLHLALSFLILAPTLGTVQSQRH